MATKPESRLIQAINRHVDRSIHREKMHNEYRGGTADVWYSGYESDMWVEYKWRPKIGPRTKHIKPDLSALQLDWLLKRHAEGRNVYVVVGSPQGHVILSYPDQWEKGFDVGDVRLADHRGVAQWIQVECGVRP